MFILLSLLFWFYILWLGNQGNKINVPSNIRGGGGGGGTEVTSHTYYYYKIKSAHNSIDPSKEILCYDALGTLVYTIPPYSGNMNYSEGTYSAPGTEQNSAIESVSTATYYVFYSTDDLVIDYKNAEFKIAKKLIRSTAQTSVRGTFQYFSVITPFKDVASVIDGRWDTQVQTEFFSEPPTGYNYAIIDLGSSKNIQAIDLVAGFYKPDDVRKYDVDFNVTLQYSTDGVNYYDISDKTHNVQFNGGKGVSFEEEDLGISFSARYLKLILENVKKLDFGQVKDANGTVIREGVYVVAFTEISAYDNIVLKSDTRLIPTTELSEDINLSGLVSNSFPTTINVLDTTGFDTSGTAYVWDGLDSYDIFSYTGLTSTSFTGVSGLSDSHSDGDKVVQEVEGDNTVYDYDYLRPKLGDRVYKSIDVSQDTLFTQSQVDWIAKKYLLEFIKNHSKTQVEAMFSPFIEVGQTIRIIDSINNTNSLYFVESVNHNSNISTSLIVARYP
jgi:hypothetical protein